MALTQTEKRLPASSLTIFCLTRTLLENMPLSPIREITTLTLNPIYHNRQLEFETDHAELHDGLDLNFPGVDTQHATHSLHTYVAAINPPLAETMIKHYVPAGETVLDPF